MPTFSVVEFTGFLVERERGRSVTDFHVVDERGRTHAVVGFRTGGDPGYRQARAEKIAARLNGKLATVRHRPDYAYWSCFTCRRVYRTKPYRVRDAC